MPTRDRAKCYEIWQKVVNVNYEVYLFYGQLIRLTSKQKTAFLLSNDAKLEPVLERDTIERVKHQPTNTAFHDYH